MRKIRFALLPLVAIGVLGLATFAARSQDSKINVPPAGYTALFNGKDLSGWQAALGYRALLKMSPEQRKTKQAELNEKALPHWKVANGVLVNDGMGADLSTIKDYKNIDMLVDWKIEPMGDSGIYLRGIPQVQIWDTDHLDPKKFAPDFGKGSGGLWNNKKNNIPLVKADNPPGEWNTFHIVMKGEKVWVDLNGKRVVDGVALENNWVRENPLPTSGPIELQHHYKADGKPGNLWFKNIYVKELPD
jgi:hypothetical protein